jgi:hypothetical protein
VPVTPLPLFCGGGGVGFPFSRCFHAFCWLVGGVAGWNTKRFVAGDVCAGPSRVFGVVGVVGSACCWVLRRHLRRVGWVFSGGRSRPGPSNASASVRACARECVWVWGVGVVVVVVGGGVVVC